MRIQPQIRDLLLEAGLTEAEVLVYMELLKQPAQTKWDMVKRTKLNRNHVYRAFERLKGLNMIKQDRFGLQAATLHTLAREVEVAGRKSKILAQKLRKMTPFLSVPTEVVEDFKVLNTKSEILDIYLMMSQLKYDTCLDFGDLEGYVPVLGGMDPVFKFRENRYNQGAKNRAICTTTGPYTQCMLRKNDMNKFQSNIERLNVDYTGKWLIFSDSNDRVMFNDFTDPDAPTGVLVKSKIVADTQRLQFARFYENLEKF